MLSFLRKKLKLNRWYKDAVIYHIYPLSFQDSNGDGKGDLQGIIDRLDYLAGTKDSLGVNAIWLSPVQKSPMKDFGYDISDYYDIDPIFGDLQTFKKLIKGARNRNLKVIMDFVANHTSVEHAWFQESKSSKDNPKRDWYIWRDPATDGGPPNNWLSVFGGSAWTLDEQTGQYYLHSFLPEQPDLNWRNDRVRQEMEKVLDFWVALGVDGFRIDAIYHLMKDPLFRDDPVNPNFEPGQDDPYNQLIHTHSQGSEDIYGTIGFLCSILEKHGDKFMVSEAYLDVPGLVESYRACQSGIHVPFNFNLIGMPWQASEYKKFIDEFETALTEKDWPNYVLGNHDRARVASRLGQQRARIAALLLFTLRGVPFIYQGEEIGMENTQIPIEKVQDPFEKMVPGLNLGRDPERTPVQWSDTVGAGFSKTDKTWLPINENFQELNAESQKNNPRSMLNLYRFLIHLKKENPVLMSGKYIPVEGGTPEVFAFMRELNSRRILVVVNFSSEPCVANISSGQGKQVFNSYMDHESDEAVDLSQISLRGDEGCIIDIV